MRMSGYTDNEHRDAMEKMRRDMDRIELVGGGQGRSSDEVKASAGSGLAIFLVFVVIAALVLMSGCGTVAGFGRDLTAVSEGVRAEMAKDGR